MVLGLAGVCNMGHNTHHPFFKMPGTYHTQGHLWGLNGKITELTLIGAEKGTQM